MAEFSSSPESKALARLREWHRAEQAPPDFRVRVAERLERLKPPAPKRALSGQAGIGLLLVAAAAAIGLEVQSDGTRITPLPEQPAAPRAAELVSLSGVVVPGSLRWRGGAAADGGDQLACQYLFSLEPEGSAPIRVRWTRCEFPSELREYTQRRSSAVAGPLRVFVAGRWSAQGQLDATELRVLSRATEP